MTGKNHKNEKQSQGPESRYRGRGMPYKHCKSLQWKLTLGENSLMHQGVNPASVLRLVFQAWTVHMKICAYCAYENINTKQKSIKITKQAKPERLVVNTTVEWWPIICYCGMDCFRFATTCRETPIHLFSALTGELVGSYRPYNNVVGQPPFYQPLDNAVGQPAFTDCTTMG